MKSKSGNIQIPNSNRTPSVLMLNSNREEEEEGGELTSQEGKRKRKMSHRKKKKKVRLMLINAMRWTPLKHETRRALVQLPCATCSLMFTSQGLFGPCHMSFVTTSNGAIADESWDDQISSLSIVWYDPVRTNIFDTNNWMNNYIIKQIKVVSIQSIFPAKSVITPVMDSTSKSVLMLVYHLLKEKQPIVTQMCIRLSFSISNYHSFFLINDVWINSVLFSEILDAIVNTPFNLAKAISNGTLN
ncbi:hypothetical protein M5K25_006842 [Dendrobium thyrsiflorum]|uniref:Uncharacterized protein n=1 Tax=Dendrobium thyrsiflorum TaxID=117978 RepID=A0ABD0VC68_DENTH